MGALRVAVLSDIHGNRWALDTVIRDIETRNIDRIFNLGDSLYGPLDPAGTARLLMSLKMDTVAGNEDRLIVENIEKGSKNPTLDYVLQELDGQPLAWLKSLRKTLTIGDFFLCHGTPAIDDDYLIERVTAGGVDIKGSTELESEIEAIGSKIVLCGHSHVPHVVYTGSGQLIVNPGSVGLPAYTDDLPFAHRMESGHPHAHYCIITGKQGHYAVEQISLPYDWHTASHRAEINNRRDWARWILSGRA